MPGSLTAEARALVAGALLSQMKPALAAHSAPRSGYEGTARSAGVMITKPATCPLISG